MYGLSRDLILFLRVDIQLDEHHLLKKLFLAPLSKKIGHQCQGLFLNSVFYHTDLYVRVCDSTSLSSPL